MGDKLTSASVDRRASSNMASIFPCAQQIKQAGDFGEGEHRAAESCLLPSLRGGAETIFQVIPEALHSSLTIRRTAFSAQLCTTNLRSEIVKV